MGRSAKDEAELNDPATLVDRLRGIYRIPIRDGMGAVGAGEEPDNPDAFVSKFETSPIMNVAAKRIEELEAALKPFAKEYPGGKNLKDETRVMPLAQGGAYYEFCLGCAAEFTVGDLRRARKAFPASAALKGGE